MSSTPSLKRATLKSGRGSRPGFSSSARMSLHRDRRRTSRWRTARACSVLQHRRRGPSARCDRLAGRRDHLLDHRVGFRVHARSCRAGCRRRGCAGSRRSARRSWRRSPVTSSSCCAVAEGAVAPRASARPPWPPLRRQARDARQQRHADAVLRSTPTEFTQSSTTASQRARQLALVHVVLVLADADALRVDLHQLGQRVLQPARDAGRAAQAHVDVGHLLARRTRWPNRPRRRPR